jgi:hypothetical protein
MTRRARVAMIPRGAVVYVWVLCVGMPQASTSQERLFSLSVKTNYTTGSQLFSNPDSPNEVERAQFLPIENFFGYGLELRYQFPETNVALGLSADYISTRKASPLRISPSRSIPAEDGYRVIPIELTAYFLIPVSGPTFGIYMGGGAGAYVGQRIYSMAGVEAPSTEQGHGFGIHVLGGLAYSFTEWFSMSGEMKFRDLQFSSSNAFPVSQILYDRTVINVSRTPFESRVHTDGIVFQLGVTASF